MLNLRPLIPKDQKIKMLTAKGKPGSLVPGHLLSHFVRDVNKHNWGLHPRICQNAIGVLSDRLYPIREEILRPSRLEGYSE